MKHFSEYSTITGVFTSAQIHLQDGEPDPRAQLGFAWFPALVDHSAQRVNLATGELVAYLPNGPSQAELEAQAREARAALLAACDWVVTKAQETGQPVPAPWREYRQALRDVSKQPGWPLQIDWPLQPE